MVFSIPPGIRGEAATEDHAAVRITEPERGRRASIRRVSRAVGLPGPVVAALLALLFGCAGSPTPSERAARGDLAEVAARYRPGDAKPELPALTGASGIEDYLRFAMLKNPRIEAAYYEWAASVERITTARSLPDPRLTFGLDVASMALSAIAGLMTDLPGPGKLRVASDAAAAESRGRYFVFESEILRTTFAVKSAYYRLQFLEESLRLARESLVLLGDLEQISQQQNAAGRGTLQDVLQAQIEQEQMKTRIENLDDSRGALRAEFKAALGLGPGDADPPVPDKFFPSGGELPDRERILEIALQRNPSIRLLEADMRRAEALLALSGKAGVPDVSIGMEAGFGAGPVMLAPSMTVTLPIWIDKIRAQIAGAQAWKRAAEARLDAGQVDLAAELAALLTMYRESVRNAKLLEERLLPKGRQALEAARAGYESGRSRFLDVIDAYRQVLDFDLALIEARTRRELALGSLSLLIAGVPPTGSPGLPPAENPGESNPKEAAK